MSATLQFFTLFVSIKTLSIAGGNWMSTLTTSGFWLRQRFKDDVGCSLTCSAEMVHRNHQLESSTWKHINVQLEVNINPMQLTINQLFHSDIFNALAWASLRLDQDSIQLHNRSRHCSCLNQPEGACDFRMSLKVIASTVKDPRVLNFLVDSLWLRTITNKLSILT